MKNNNFLSVPIFLLMAGCAAEKPLIPPPLDLPKKVLEYSSFESSGTRDAVPSTMISETPKPPPATKTETIKAAPPLPASAGREEANITLAFEQIPLPTFIQVVYGTTLKKNVNVDPAIVARQDLVTIRTGSPQTPTQVAEAARMLLKSYGISVIDLGSIVRIVPDNANLGYLPEIRRGRALPETPLPLRPIFQLVELQAVRNTDIAAWIKNMFADKVTMYEDPARNAVWLSGQSENVTAALEAIHVLDQPSMRGRQSVRITPAYMSADELTKKLTEIMQAEGYSAGPQGPIALVSIPSVNAVIVFAGDQAIVDHVVKWAADLDKPGAKGIGRSFFSYQVQYTDAQALAQTLEKVLGGSVAKPVGTAAAGAPALARVVVDQGSNTIIFQGSAEDYGQIKSLLELLDRPTKQALMEVTVAEVTLTDGSSFGVEWLLKNAGLGALAASQTKIGAAGLTYTRLGPESSNDVRILLTALANNNRATILSSPRVVSRNGETATIQVGDDVPIVTSTQTNTNTGASPVQTIQYRNSGVILKVRPVIHSGNQIDLDVAQEVSTASETKTGVTSSPTFSSKKLETKLALKDGATVLLGGLISTTSSNGSNGLPILKDIPGIGPLFGSTSSSNNRKELIVLITTYIISNENDAQAVTDAFKKQLGPWAQTLPATKQPPLPVGNGSSPTDSLRPTSKPMPESPLVPQLSATKHALDVEQANKPSDAANKIVNPGSSDAQPK